MFLVSTGAEYKYKIKNLINPKLITYFNEDDLNNDYSNYNYIITDNNKKVIEYFLSLNKKVIVIDYNKKIKSNKNIKVITNNKDLVKTITTINNKNKKIKKTKYILSLLLFLSFLSLILIQLKPKEERYLFLGDSITEYYALDNYYKDKVVFNSGIGGDKAYNILNDLKERVFDYKPTTIFLLIGTNDMGGSTNKEIVNNIIKICDKIHSKNKKIKIYVESIYPISHEKNDKVLGWMVGRRDNNRIKKINKELKESAKEHNYTYLDLYSILVDENDNLKLDYTVDGLHISEEGYKVISNEIKKLMK